MNASEELDTHGAGVSVLKGSGGMGGGGRREWGVPRDAVSDMAQKRYRPGETDVQEVGGG